MKVVYGLCPIILHFGIIIHPASPPTQSVLVVVWRIAPQEGLISEKCQCSRWRHFGYSIRLVLHCNFKDAETGLMAHYHKWMKHKAKLLLGKCQSIAVDLGWRRYDVKMAEHLIFKVSFVFTVFGVKLRKISFHYQMGYFEKSHILRKQFLGWYS